MNETLEQQIADELTKIEYQNIFGIKLEKDILRNVPVERMTEAEFFGGDK